MNPTLIFMTANWLRFLESEMFKDRGNFFLKETLSLTRDTQRLELTFLIQSTPEASISNDKKASYVSKFKPSYFLIKWSRMPKIQIPGINIYIYLYICIYNIL